jgi:hypothetical protein
MRFVLLVLVVTLGCHARRLAPRDNCPIVYPSGATIDQDGTATLNGAPIEGRERCDLHEWFVAPYRGPWGLGEGSAWYAASILHAPLHGRSIGPQDQIWAHVAVDFWVPQPPTQLPTERAADGREQGIGFFPGIMTSPMTTGPSWILQPVLFYGEEPPGSGHFEWWATAVFNQLSAAPQQMSALVAVPSGAGMRGIIELKGEADDGSRVYRVAFASTESASEFTSANFIVHSGVGSHATPMALEIQVDPLQSCAELPSGNGGLSFWNMRLGIPTFGDRVPNPDILPIPTMVLGVGSDNSYADEPDQRKPSRCDAVSNYAAGATSGSITWNVNATP